MIRCILMSVHFCAHCWCTHASSLEQESIQPCRKQTHNHFQIYRRRWLSKIVFAQNYLSLSENDFGLIRLHDGVEIFSFASFSSCDSSLFSVQWKIAFTKIASNFFGSLSLSLERAHMHFKLCASAFLFLSRLCTSIFLQSVLFSLYL